MQKLFVLMALIGLYGCKSKTEKVHPTVASISESIYASGIIKSLDQYQAYATVNGIIEKVFVSEGDTVTIGTPLLLISNETQKLNKENAALAEEFSDYSKNQGKLSDAKQLIEVAKTKLRLDSSLYYRQKNLWQQQVGSKAELEQRELAYQNSKAAYTSALLKYDDLKRQLAFNSSQSKNNLQISGMMESDFTLKSEINGVVFSLLKLKGELVGLQTPLAILGNPKQFILEMQVDEYDIFKLKAGLVVLVTLDSYKGKVFKARVSKIYPLMNERSKTFKVEALFTEAPEKLYPNITFEANIILQTKENALLVPRNYLVQDSFLINGSGDKVPVKTGLKDFQKVEILSGISKSDELQKPTE